MRNFTKINGDDEVVDLVDDQDVVIGQKLRSELTIEDIIRVSSCFVVDKKGNILIAQRASIKKTKPNIWSTAVSETVKSGETYGSAATRGSQEEINLPTTTDDLLIQDKYYQTYEYAPQNFKTRYIVVCTEEQKKILRPKEDEVAELRWVSLPELEQLIKQNPEQYSISLPRMLAHRSQKRDEIMGVLLAQKQ